MELLAELTVVLLLAAEGATRPSGAADGALGPSGAAAEATSAMQSVAGTGTNSAGECKFGGS